jgi:hypothetical protein
MSETLLALLTAHLVGDFPLQPGWMVGAKRNPAVLLLHIALQTVLAGAVLGNYLAWPLLAILAGTHLVMDAIKVHLLGDELAAFIADQLVHLLVIVVLAVAFPLTVAQGWWPQTLPPEVLRMYLLGLTVLAAVIGALQVGAILVRKVTAPFASEVGEDIQGLTNGGIYIGVLERALVLLLVLLGQPAGVGFLLTAKSILRFGDVKDSRGRKLTEYIIIGTFLSFGWGLAVALVAQAALHGFLQTVPPAAVP